MRIAFGKLNKKAVIPTGNAGVLPLVTPGPLELQSGERLDLKTGLTARVPEGYILSIQSSPALLTHKGLEVLGPTFITPEDEEEIKIPLYNVGKSQLNLQPGMQVAVAILHLTEEIEVIEFDPRDKQKEKPEPPRRRNDPFKFEVS